jgi:iron complex outermembrane receptor protein
MSNRTCFPDKTNENTNRQGQYRGLASSAMAVFLLALFGAKAHAQATTSSEEPIAQLGEIVVTAQKRKQNVQDTPLSVTAISGDALTQVGVTNVMELSHLDPALQIGHATGSVTTFIRGIGNPVTTAGNEASVPVYIDDVYFVRASYPFFDLNSIDHVEVLKGPQGTLFGRNASGGVISIYTKDPDLHASAADLSVGYGNYDTVTAKGYGNIALTDTLAVNLAVNYRDQGDGWGFNKALVDPLDTAKGYQGGGLPYWLGRSISGRGKILWQPTDTTSVKVIGYYENSWDSTGIYSRPFPGTVGGSPDPAHNGFPLAPGMPGYGLPPAGGPYAQALPPLGFYDVSLPTQPEFDASHGGGGSVRVDQGVGFADFVSITAYRKNHELYFSDGNYSPYNWLLYYLNIVDDQFSQEFQLKSKAGSPFSWIGGLYYLDANGGFSPTTITGGGPNVAGLAGVDLFGQQNTKSYAGFTQATYPILDTTNLTLGLRYTKDDVDGVGQTNTRFLPAVATLLGLPSTTLPGPVYRSDAKFSKVTWKDSLDHKFTDKVMAYISDSRGYKAGTFNTLPLDSPALQPEVVDTYELGVKSEMAEGRVRLNGALFWNDLKNPQVQAQKNGLVFLENAGSARTKGAEFDLTALAADGLTLRLAGTLLDARFRSFPSAPSYCPNPNVSPATCQALTPTLPLAAGNVNTIAVDADGHQMPYASKLKVTVGANYETHFAGIGRTVFDLNGDYNSKFNWDADNLFQEPAHFLVDGSIAVTPEEKMTIMFWAKNITGVKYNVGYYAQASGSAFSSSPGAPRTYGAEVQFKF